MNDLQLKKDEIMNLTPTELFDFIKSKKMENNSLDDSRYYASCYKMLDKAISLGQTRQITKLQFIISVIEREKEVRALGISEFIYAKEVTYFVDRVENQVVKITDLEEYPREIPDHVYNKILKAKDVFDEIVVLFTDYTGEVEKEIEKSKRDKDPIAFGIFYDSTTDTVYDRMYFIADWEDEYCDLTLDKLVEEYKDMTDKDIIHYIDEPTQLEIKEMAEVYIENTSKNSVQTIFLKDETIKDKISKKIKRVFKKKSKRK